MRKRFCHLLFMLFVFLLPIYAYGEDKQPFTAEVESYTYDLQERPALPVREIQYYMDEYQLSFENAEYYANNRGHYRKAWLRIHVTTALNDVEIHKVKFLRKEETPRSLVFFQQGYEIVERHEDSSINIIMDAKIENASEAEIEQIVRESKIDMVIRYTLAGDDTEYEYITRLDVSQSRLDRHDVDGGFKVKMNYCDVYDWENGKVLLRGGGYPKEVHEYEGNGLPVPYYVCVLRGVKTKQMEYPIIDVQFESEDIDDGEVLRWISVTNTSMFWQGEEYSPWADKMYENGSEYVEIRMIIRIPDEYVDNSFSQRAYIKEFIEGTEIKMFYATEGYQSGNRTEENEHRRYDFTGPRNQSSVDMSDVRVNLSYVLSTWY